MDLELAWSLVKKFHEEFGHPIGTKPTRLDQDRVKKRYTWMLEELEEFMYASTTHDQADAIIDLTYFALGTLVEMGIRPQRLFEIVHRANMAKKSPQGEYHYNNEGKTLKPEGWQDPSGRIIEELEHQLSQVDVTKQ